MRLSAIQIEVRSRSRIRKNHRKTNHPNRDKREPKVPDNLRRDSKRFPKTLTGRQIHRARDCAIWLPGLAQAESKRIAGMPRNGVPAGRSNMQKAFVGETEARV